jgi:hypothetical protein
MAIAAACPKCQRERRPGEDACARCGLVVTRWEGFAAVSVGLAGHPLLDGLWAAVEADWNDGAAHERFLDQAASARRLDVAAARYGAARRTRPGDARAESGLKRAALLVERLLEVERTTPVPSGTRLVQLALAFTLAGLALLLFWARFH